MGLGPEAVKQALRQKVRQAASEILHRGPGGASVSHEGAGQSELPAEITYKSTIPWDSSGRANALVVLCSDWQFLHHSEDFLRQGLKLSEYGLVAVPGGVQWLALPDILPKHNKVARWVTEFLIKSNRFQRVVCIAHEDCGAYQDSGALASLAHLATGKSIVEHQLEQLRTVGRHLSQTFHVQAELYYASVSEGSVVFHKVE